MIKRTDGTDIEKEKLAEKSSSSEKKEQMLETDTEKMLTSSPPAEVTNSQKIWEEISEKKIEMFSIPNQKVSMHVNPKTAFDAEDLFITLNSGAALPALETALGSNFTVEIVGEYVKISRKK